MYRVCLKKDGSLIEMQSGGDHIDTVIADANLNTLRQNALNSGHKEEELDVKWLTDEEWAVMWSGINQLTKERVAEIKKENLIQAKLRELAEAALKTEGVLDAEGKVAVK